MWTAKKIVYNGDDGFIAAYIGDTLVWKYANGSISIYISEIEEGKTAEWNGQILSVGWNLLDLSNNQYSHFSPPLSNIKNATITDVTFNGYDNTGIESIQGLLWNEGMRKYIDLNTLNFNGANFEHIKYFVIGCENNSATSGSDGFEGLDINTVEGNLYLPICTSMENCFERLRCPNFNMEVIDAPLLMYCRRMFKRVHILKAPQLTSKYIKDMSYMFSESEIEEIPVIDCTNVTSITGAFEKCINLYKMDGLVGLKKGVSFSHSPLTAASMRNIGNTIAESDGAVIYISDYTEYYMTDEIRALFTNKGWQIRLG